MFPATKQVRLIDQPEPALVQPTDVKINILNVGVCGTDREIWEFKYGAPPPGADYLITGHESFGQVVQVGAAVKTVKVGDYVVPTVRRGCPENCLSCANGRPDFCFTGHFTERGIKQRHGYMTEFVVDEERYMNVVPAELKNDAVLLEPLTIAEKALMQITLIQSRLHWECRLESARDKSCRNALILGAGPVGLLGALLLRLQGMRTTVLAREPTPNAKAKIIEQFGGEYHSTKTETPRQIADSIGNIDVIFEATGAAGVSFEYMQVLGTNGIFIFTGVPAPLKDITIDAGTLMRDIVLNNQVVLGTVNAPKEAFENGIRDLLAMRQRWPHVLDALITDRLPLARFPEAMTRENKNEIKTILTLA